MAWDMLQDPIADFMVHSMTTVHMVFVCDTANRFLIHLAIIGSYGSIDDSAVSEYKNGKLFGKQSHTSH